MVLAHEYREPSKFCHWLILGIKKMTAKIIYYCLSFISMWSQNQILACTNYWFPVINVSDIAVEFYCLLDKIYGVKVNSG